MAGMLGKVPGDFKAAEGAAVAFEFPFAKDIPVALDQRLTTTGAPGAAAHNRREAGHRALGAGVLRGVGRAAAQARHCKNIRGVEAEAAIKSLGEKYGMPIVG